MKIDNQQVRQPYVNIDELLLHGISVEKQINKNFTTEMNLKFIRNINNDYDFFLKEFNLSRDQTKRIKKKIFDQYELIIPDTFIEIVGFPAYLISKAGLIVTKRTRRILKQSLNRKGYPVVCLTNKSTKTVHRALAETWIINEFNKPEVNHKDGIKVNNFISNLEWCTQAENALHKKLHNLGKTRKAKIAATGQNNSQAKLLPIHIFNIRSSSNLSCDLANEYNVTQATINDIKARRSWKHI